MNWLHKDLVVVDKYLIEKMKVKLGKFLWKLKQSQGRVLASLSTASLGKPHSEMEVLASNCLEGAKEKISHDLPCITL